jgi:hypothetical protein
MGKVFILLIFTDGGSSGRLMPPTAVEIIGKLHCEIVATRVQVAEPEARAFCIAKEGAD